LFSRLLAYKGGHMAKQNTPHIVARKENITSITDMNGQTIIQIGSSQYTVRNSDGSLTHRFLNQLIPTVDGFEWGPDMQKAKPPVHVGICQQCRDGSSLFGRNKSHGIVTLARAKLCADCGTLCCPSHRRLSKNDRRWRCLRHHRMHRIGGLVRPLFFERTD